jgi:hypothetical protein
MSLPLSLVGLILWIPFVYHGKPSCGPFAARPAQSRRVIEGWRLTVRQDRFTGRNTCLVARGRQSLDRQVLVLRLPETVDTSRAVYRVDWGAPMAVSDDRAVVATLGHALWRDDLFNPSGGLVRIPYAKVANAHMIAVEAQPGGRIWTFSLAGLSAALAAAKSSQCA